jgi:hypothetical protein
MCSGVNLEKFQTATLSHTHANTKNTIKIYILVKLEE